MALATVSLILSLLAAGGQTQDAPVDLGFAKPGNAFELRVAKALSNRKTALSDLATISNDARSAGNLDAQAVAAFWMGEVVFESPEWQQASAAYTQASTLLNDGGNERLRARSLLGRGTVLLRAGSFNAAVEDLQAADTLWQALKSDRDRSPTLLRLANAQFHAAPARWEATLTTCTVLAQKLGDNRTLVGASRLQAQSLATKSEWAGCREAAQEGIDLCKKGPFWMQDRADCRRFLAIAQIGSSPSGEVLETARAARDDYEASDKDRGYPEYLARGVLQCTALAVRSLVDMQMWDEAKLELAGRGIPQSERRLLVYIAVGSGDVAAALSLLENETSLGDSPPILLETCRILWNRSDWEGLAKIADFGITRLSASPTPGGRRGLGILYDYRGQMQQCQGNFTLADTSFEESIKLLSAASDSGPRAMAQIHRAEMLALAGQFTVAKSVALTALDSARTSAEGTRVVPGGFPYLAEVEFHFGRVQLLCGDSEPALESWRLAQEHAQEAGANELAGKCRFSQGNALYGLGRYAEAVELFREVLKSGSRSQTAETRAVWQVNLARALLRSGKADEARFLIIQALPVIENSQDASNISLVRFLLGRSLWATGDKSTAILFGKSSLLVLQNLVQSSAGVGPEAQSEIAAALSDRFQEVAGWLCSEGRLAEAEEVLFALKSAQFERLMGERSGDSEKVTLSGKEKAWLDKFAELGTSVLAAARELDQLSRVASRTQVQEERMAQLTTVVWESSRVFQGFVDAVRSDLGQANPSALTSQISIQRAAKQAAQLASVPGNPAIIFPFVTANGVQVIVATSGATVVRAPALVLDAKRLNSLIAEFRSSLTLPQSDPTKPGQLLYSLLVAPIMQDLKASGTRHLVWMLEGGMQRIPLAALSDPETGRYLIQDFPLSVMSYGDQDLGNFSHSPNRQWKGAGFGVTQDATVGDIHFKALKGVGAELDGFHRFVPGADPRLDSQFDLDSLLKTLLSRPNILHVATHFELRPGSDQESFMLMGGSKILTIADFRALPSLAFNSLDFAVFSACQSATPREAGPSGGATCDTLASVAEEKGAASVLATLWKVFDSSTSKLMVRFYRLRSERPESTKAELLQQIQIEMIEGRLTRDSNEQDPGPDDPNRNGGNERPEQAAAKWPAGRPVFSHPYYWAPFVLFGDWR